MNGSGPIPVAALPLQWRVLLAAAEDAADRAHAPYSRFRVGAAVRTANGRIFAGCNIENASYGLTVCAERVAIWKAVSEGELLITSLALVSPGGATPCGACRQVMAEFAADMDVLVATASRDGGGRALLTSLSALLPRPFPEFSLVEGSAFGLDVAPRDEEQIP